MTTVAIEIRRARDCDAADLAALHCDAWRYAYRGIIPGLTLERMLSRRGPAWWRRASRLRGGTLLLAFDGRAAGYATFGRCRSRAMGAGGEIYELYLRPEFHGVGLGRRLFGAARASLAEEGLRSLAVWSLADNEAACRFYSAMGGRERLRAIERLGGARLPVVAYHWR